jgi:hypothetical protein
LSGHRGFHLDESYCLKIRNKLVPLHTFLTTIDGDSSFVLKLIDTKDTIQCGEELGLNLPDYSSWLITINLAQHLAIPAQPIPTHLVDSCNPMVMSDPSDKVEQELLLYLGHLGHKRSSGSIELINKGMATIL